MASESQSPHSHLHDKRLAVIRAPRAPRVTQKILLHERKLTKEIRELQKKRAGVRAQIRHALERGGKCEPGPRTAAIEWLGVLDVS
jgi:hypothetical protein